MLLPFELMGVSMPSFLQDKAWVDDVIHFFTFIPWMLLSAALFKSQLARVRCFILGLLIVLGIEIAQMRVPCRGFSLDDLFAGAAGMVCSYVLFIRVWRRSHSGKHDV